MSNPLLSVRAASVNFGGIQALDQVTFDVDHAQIVSLIGPNGAGKTSLINCITRVYAPTSGDIFFNGKSTRAFAVHQMTKLGISRTFQNLALFPSMTVMQNVLMGTFTRTKSDFMSAGLKLPWLKNEEKKAREIASEVISFLKLESHADEVVTKLPYGTRKRVEMARALASSPKLLLLDEPAAGLSGDEVKKTEELVHSIQASRRVTILLVEHNMHLVMHISEKIVVLNLGKKIAEGTPAKIKEDPKVIEAYLGTSEGAKA